MKNNYFKMNTSESNSGRLIIHKPQIHTFFYNDSCDINVAFLQYVFFLYSLNICDIYFFQNKYYIMFIV